MTFNEFRILTKAMKAVYTSPNFLPDTYAVKLWYQMLKDIQYEQATVAIQEYMLTNKFPPTIADIRALTFEREIQDWGTGWQKALNAIRKYGWCRQKEALAELDDITRQTVERLGYMELCTSENLMADRGNFRMIYEQIAEREKDRQCLPEELQSRIKAMQERSIDDRRNTRRSAQLTERQADEAERNQPAVRTE